MGQIFKGNLSIPIAMNIVGIGSSETAAHYNGSRALALVVGGGIVGDAGLAFIITCLLIGEATLERL